MATTFVEYTGDGNATKQFTFPSLQESDVKVRVDGVLKTTSTHYNITSYTTTGGGNVVFTSGNIPSSPANIRIYRDTSVDVAKATYTAGSSVKAADLNNNNTQLLYRAQEEQVPNLIHSYDIDAEAIETSNIKADAITSAKIADDQIDSEHYVAGSIDLEHMSANSIDSDQYVDGSIDEAHLSNSAVTQNKLANNSVGTTELINGSVNSDKILDGTIVNADVNASAAIAGTKISPNFGSQVIQTTGNIVVGGTVDGADVAAMNTKLAGIESGATADQTASEIKTLLQSDKLTASEIATGALDGRYFTETELNNGALDGRYFTETEADARYFNISTGDTIKDGQAFPDNDTTIATTAAINDRIIDLVDDVGGFVPIANETSFPTANPDVNNGSGTLVSVKAISSTRTPSSGTVTIANGAGTGNTVTITGCGSTVLTAGFGIIVETTTTLHTYAFHRLVPKATEVTTVAGISSNVTTVANNTSNINAVAADASDIGTVAGAITNVNNVGNSIANVNTTAGSIANVNTVAGSISNVNSVASNISNVNAVNSNESNINSAVSNASNINSAVSNASNINTVAGSISNVNTTAGSISNVNTVASNISSVNNFFNVYRTGANNPTTSLDTGDLFFNTTSNSLKVYTGSAWVDGVTATGNFAVTTGNTFSGSNGHNDNVKSTYGTGQDLQIFHDGNHSRIVDEGTGSLFLDSNGNGVTIRKNQAENVARFLTDGACELYYDNSKKLDTKSDGVLVTGELQATTLDINGSSHLDGTAVVTGNLDMPDNAKVLLGTGDDLEIYHNGNHSIIDGSGTGDLKLIGDDVVIQATNDEAMAKFIENGSVELYHNNSKKFETTSSGVSIAGSANLGDSNKLRFGNSQDLSIYHNGTHSFITNATNDLTIECETSDAALILKANHIHLKDEADQTFIKGIENTAAVELYYGGSKKFETTTDGAIVNGKAVVGGNLEINQDAYLKIGASADLQLYHVSGNSEIYNATGNLRIRAANNLQLETHDNEMHIKCIEDGAVELYHNGSKKFETLAAGTTTTGTSQLDGDVKFTSGARHKFIGGGNGNELELGTYSSSNTSRDVHMQLNSGGTLYLTGNLGIGKQTPAQLGGDGGKLLHIAGADNPEIVLERTTSGTEAKASLRITDAEDLTFRVQDGSGTEYDAMHLRSDIGSVELNYQGSTRLQTTTGGVIVTGDFQTSGSGGTITANEHLKIPNDTGKLQLGASNDLQIYHNGTDTFIDNHQGDLFIRGDGDDIFLKAVDTKDSVRCRPNTSVELYYDDSKKLETGSHGVNVTDGEFRIGDASDGNDALIRLGATGTNTDTHGVMFYDKSDNSMSFVVAGESHGVGGLMIRNGGNIKAASIFPHANNTHDLGSASSRWANIYTQDLQLSNEAAGDNGIDGTWGDYTIVEGESDLFLKNNRSGKTFKFNLTEVS